jgi:hypothetical protein
VLSPPDRYSTVAKGEQFSSTRFCHVRWSPVKLYTARKRSSDRPHPRLVAVRRGIQTSLRLSVERLPYPAQHGRFHFNPAFIAAIFASDDQSRSPIPFAMPSSA